MRPLVRAASPLVLPPVHVLAGGFPCQDISGDGKGAGLDGARSGLWWEYHRCIASFRPTVAIIENVASGRGRWLPAVRRSLHELGYFTAALEISAEDVGAPHRRERIFLVAFRTWQPIVCAADLPACECCGEPFCELCELHYFACACAGPHSDEHEIRVEPWGAVAYPVRELPQGDGADRQQKPRGPVGALLPGRRDPRRGGSPEGHRYQPQSGMDRGVDGVSDRVDGVAAPAVRWPAGRGEPQHGWEPPRAASDVPQQDERLIALGNAVVPACAEVVGRWILENL